MPGGGAGRTGVEAAHAPAQWTALTPARSVQTDPLTALQPRVTAAATGRPRRPGAPVRGHRCGGSGRLRGGGRLLGQSGQLRWPERATRKVEEVEK